MLLVLLALFSLSVSAASYTVRFREGYEPSFDYRSAFEQFKAKKSIMITKQTKKSEKELDLAPSIYEMKLTEDGIYMMVKRQKPNFYTSNLIGLYIFSISIPFFTTFMGISNTIFSHKIEIISKEEYAVANEFEINKKHEEVSVHVCRHIGGCGSVCSGTHNQLALSVP